MDKKESRLRRARKPRAKMRELGATRLSVYRTPKHIYAQVISTDGSQTLATASTIDKALKTELSNTGNKIEESVFHGGKIKEQKVLDDDL